MGAPIMCGPDDTVEDVSQTGDSSSYVAE
jgi:hypothetical protein